MLVENTAHSLQLNSAYLKMTNNTTLEICLQIKYLTVSKLSQKKHLWSIGEDTEMRELRYFHICISKVILQISEVTVP